MRCRCTTSRRRTYWCRIRRRNWASSRGTRKGRLSWAFTRQAPFAQPNSQPSPDGVLERRRGTWRSDGREPRCAVLRGKRTRPGPRRSSARTRSPAWRRSYGRLARPEARSVRVRTGSVPAPTSCRTPRRPPGPFRLDAASTRPSRGRPEGPRGDFTSSDSASKPPPRRIPCLLNCPCAAALRLPVSCGTARPHGGNAETVPVVVLAAVVSFVATELLPQGPGIPEFRPRVGRARRPVSSRP